MGPSPRNHRPGHHRANHGQPHHPEILQPLHLGQTSYSTSSELPSPSALGYIVSDGSAEAVPLYDLSNLGAAGGMVSTVSDMAVWAQAFGNGELLSPSLEAERLQFGPA